MAEGNARPTAAKLYEAPSDSGRSGGSTYLPPGAPGQAMMYDQRYHPRDSAESASDQRGGTALDGKPPAVGQIVEHTKSGIRGTVVGHETHGYHGTAQPRVQWAGEDTSWPQGVNASSIRVVGSTPEDLYTVNQDATSHRPLNRNTGAA